LIEVLKQSVEIRNPQNQDDDDQSIQERFDLALHGDESIHKPQQDACCNNCDEDGGKWHFVFSNHFSIRSPRHRQEIPSVRITLHGSHQVEANDDSATPPFFRIVGEIAEP
jgi:hypothetical protein